MQNNPSPNDSQNQLWLKIVDQLQSITQVMLDPAPQPSDSENVSATNFLNILDRNHQ